MKWRPIRCHLTVKIIREKKSAGGIIITDSSLEHMAKEEGIVIGMGEDMFPDSDPSNRPNLKIGDVVAFARYGGKQLGEDSEHNEIRVMRDIDILAVKEEE